MANQKDKRFMFLKLNTISALIYQLVNVIYGIVLPNLFITHYGSEVNGLVSSISQYLGMIAFCEMGVGAVVQSAFYKPLAARDVQQVSRVMSEANAFFRKIAYIFVAYVIVLIFAFPMLVHSESSFLTTTMLILALAINSFSQYFFGLVNQILLNADQKQFINYTIQIVCTIVTAVVVVIMITAGCSIELVKLVTALIMLVRPLLLKFYVDKYYSIDKHVRYEGTAISQKGSAIAHHISYVILDHTDVVVLSSLSTMVNVSIYYIYYMVVSGIRQIVVYALAGIEALFGNVLVTESKEKTRSIFEFTEWIVHAGCTVLFSITAMMILPFMMVYTRNVTDANYIAPLFAYLLVAAQYVYCIRLPYHSMIKAAGLYRETRNSAMLEAALNVVISVVFVIRYGLVGVAVGTLVAMGYKTIYYMIFLRKNLIHRSASAGLKLLMTDAISVAAICAAVSPIKLKAVTYGAWVLMGVEVSLLAVLVEIVVLLVFYRENMMQLFRKLKR